MGTTPPSSNSRHHRYRWIGWRSRSFYPPPKKNKTHGNHPPLQQCAPSPVLKQVDGRPRPVFEGIGGRPPIPGFQPAPSRRAPGALPPGWLPSEIHRHPGHRTNAPATPSPCTKSKPAVGLPGTLEHHSSHGHPNPPTHPAGRSSVRIRHVMRIRRAGTWTPRRHLSPPPREQSGAPTTARPQRRPRQPT